MSAPVSRRGAPSCLCLCGGGLLAVAALCALCHRDATARTQARKAGCLEACKTLLACEVDARSATCRIAISEALLPGACA